MKPERLASAGLRAYGRFDVPAAENLLSRAKALLPAGHDQRPKVLRRLTEAYPVMGRPEEAIPILQQRLEFPNQRGEVKRELEAAMADAGLLGDEDGEGPGNGNGKAKGHDKD